MFLWLLLKFLPPDFNRSRFSNIAIQLSFSVWSQLEFAKLVKGKSYHQYNLHYLPVVIDYRWSQLECTIEFSNNTQSLQHWHLCTSNGNKSETVENWVSFNANWHLPKCFEFILKCLIFKNKQYKNAKIAKFVHYGKTRIASFGTTDIFWKFN